MKLGARYDLARACWTPRVPSPIVPTTPDDADSRSWASLRAVVPEAE